MLFAITCAAASIAAASASQDYPSPILDPMRRMWGRFVSAAEVAFWAAMTVIVVVGTGVAVFALGGWDAVKQDFGGCDE